MLVLGLRSGTLKVARNDATQQIVGPERRLRVLHLDWCGEGCAKSRRPVNSDVRRPFMNSPVSSEWIVNATRAYISENAKTHPEIAAFVETLAALPLYVDWNGGVALRPDGELIGFLWDEPQSIKVETDAHLRFLALVTGSERYSELVCLSPQRTSSDRDCASCGGTGRLLDLEAQGVDTTHIRCYCGGAGWLPANVPDLPGS